MNIIMLAPLPPPSGGIASWTVRYKNYCEDNDIKLKIINTAVRGKRAQSETLKSNFIIEIIRSIDIAVKTILKISNDKPDLVHFNTSCSPLGIVRDAFCIILIPSCVPVIVHCRCNIADQIGNKRISQKALTYVLSKAKRIIVLNKYSLEFVKNVVNKDAVIIPNFVNNTDIIDKKEIRDTIENVIYVGHVERAKGLIQIIGAAKKFPNITFSLVGAVREDISQLSFPNNVVFVGRVDGVEVKQFLAKADVFLFPSLSEGFSNSLLEAMAFGLPSIVSDVGANKDMIENKGGIVLKNNTVEEIVEAINLLSNCVVREKMSKWCINKVKKDYSKDTVMGEYLSLYNETIHLK